jgi:hypothetical protein
MVIRRRKAQLDRLEAQLAALREDLALARKEVGHARHDLAQLDRETYSRVEKALNAMREAQAELLGYFADAKARRVVVGPDTPTGVRLELSLRSPDQARQIADQLREAAFLAGSDGST